MSNAAARQRAAEKRRRREIEMRRRKAESRRPHGEGAGEKKLTIGDLPIAECVISKGWEERGLAHILLARRLPDGNLIVGGYYVDTLCLGIKDSAVLERMSEGDYRNNIKPTIFNDPVEFSDCGPELARAVAEGGAEFAARFGFKPNKRWDEARKMFAGIMEPAEPVKFGRNGVPCYVRRGETNAEAILLKLERYAGPGKYLVEDGGE